MNSAEFLLKTAVYTADHGYAWVAVPTDIPANVREHLLANALSSRPDFPEDNTVNIGVVAYRGIAAAYSIRRVKGWDAEGRDADYAAFAFVPCAQAAEIDFAALLEHDFFHSPARTPPAEITYSGVASEPPPLDAPGRLLCKNRVERFNPHAIGMLLSVHAAHSDSWNFKFEDGECTVTTTSWHR